MKIKKFIPKTFEDRRGKNIISFEDSDTGICLKKSISKKGVFRGLHIQIPPYEQTKYISVTEGSIIDYVLCLDAENKDFGLMKHFRITNKDGFFKIPKYCAHGYYAEDNTVFTYVCEGKYSEENEITILMNEEFYKDKIVSKKDIDGITINKAIDQFKKIKWK